MKKNSFIVVPLGIVLLAWVSIWASSARGDWKCHEMLVVPGDAKHSRNSEADIVELKDGRLLLGWSDFYKSDSEDWGPCKLSGKTSDDGGLTWSKPFTILDNEGKRNTMEVDFLRLPSGDLALFYCRNNGDDDCRVMMRKSKDDGKTWGDPKQLSDWHGYVGTTNNRAILTSKGRIVLPFFYCINDVFLAPQFSVCQVFYSDDEGETWNISRPPLASPYSAGGSAEPTVAELSDGKLLMMLRGKSGRIYKSISTDGGSRWERPEPTELATSESPICLKRIPKTNDLLVIWNQASKKEIEWGMTRGRLSCAISSDDGATWNHFKNLESLDDRTHVEPAPIGEPPHSHRPIWESPYRPDGPLNCSYPSCTFDGENALITYDVPAAFCALKLRIIPLGWFYDDKAPSFKSGRGSDDAAMHMPRAPQIEKDKSSE